MVKPHTAILIICLLGIFVLFSGCVNPGAPAGQGNANVQTREIRVDNGALMYPVVSKAATGYMGLHAGDAIVVNNDDTSGASIQSLIANNTDMAGASRAPLDSEYQAAKAKGVDLHLTQVGADAVCVVVNPSNPVSDLNKSQLNDIFFTGNITDWGQVTNGTKTGPIHVYVVNTSGSSISWQFDHDVKTSLSTAYVTIDNNNKSQSEIMPQVIYDPNGVTIGSLGYMNASYKAVKVNGVLPSKGTVLDATYPITLKLYLVTNGVPAGLSKDFINYLLSTDGQKIVTNSGLISIM